MKVVNYIEIDIDYCALLYGTTNAFGTCSAAIGVTGDIKCFNSLVTCQVREDFVNEPVTLRFAVKAGFEGMERAVPSITGIDYTPGIISLGEDLGTRASLKITFEDHPWNDTWEGFDKYYAERPYVPFDTGTFWGKFRARQPYLRGRPLRWIRGVHGQAIEDMEVRYFYIDSFSGPSDDVYTLTAKDGLKLADGDRAQAPTLSPGFLNAAIDTDDLALVLAPSGIGAFYPASGTASIGGKEIVTFTRSGDDVTITGRAQHGTEAQNHAAQDRFQICLVYTAEDPANIIYDLLLNYAAVPMAVLPVAAWLVETGAFLRRVYTTVIPEPTSVRKLINEIINQSGLAVWWDDMNNQVNLQVVRTISTNAALFDMTNVVEGSVTITDQPDKRISEVQTFFAKKNPLEGEDPFNFQSGAVTTDLASATDYGSAAIRQIFSRWIATGGRTIAERVNDILLGRFRDAPRKVAFSVWRDGPITPVLGGGYQFVNRLVQSATGDEEIIPIQIVRLRPTDTGWDVEAEEVRASELTEEDLTNRFIIIDSDQTNVDYREMHDNLYPPLTTGDTVTLVVEQNAVVGSTSTSIPALVVGAWPESGISINVTIYGRVQGAGGAGGKGRRRGSGSAADGEDGGTALYTRQVITLTDADGVIAGGGGGGGGAGTLNFDDHYGGGGGGGAGRIAGAGGATGGGSAQNGSPGTLDDGGQGGRSYASFNWYTAPGITSVRGGTGGDAGEAGNNGGDHNGNTEEENSNGDGGAAGAAIDGLSFISSNPGGPGDRRGPEIN